MALRKRKPLSDEVAARALGSLPDLIGACRAASEAKDTREAKPEK